MIDPTKQDPEHQTDVNCPACGKPQTVTPVTTLRPDDPDLEALFRGQLNVVQCGDCGRVFSLQVPIVYRDDENRTIIYYMPVDDQSKVGDAEKRMAELAERIFTLEELIEEPVCRLTTTMRAFLEKIALSVHELDDRVIEYLKYQLINQQGSKIDPVRTELLYDFSTPTADCLTFVMFDRETGSAEAGMQVSMDYYEGLCSTFASSPAMEAELQDLFGTVRVTVDKLLAGD